MPAYMELNGAPCVLSSQLLSESLSLPHLDFNISEWEGKANAFHHQRGSKPSYGYLLITEASFTGSPSGLRIVFQDGTDKTFKVQITSVKKVTPAYFSHQGYYLAQVVDERYALAQTFVGKRFNLVEYFTPGSSPSQGTFAYVKETIKEISSTLSVPYSWPDLFLEVFKVPSGQTLQTNGITFPTYVPQDLDWRYVTQSQALEMLLQWTGTSIVYQEGDQNWKLVALEDVNNSNRDSLLAAYDQALCKSRFSNFKSAGSPRPKNFKLHFRRLEPSDAKVEQYKVIDKAPSQTPQSGVEIPIRLPSYFVDDSTAPFPPEEVSTEWLSRVEKYLFLFPSQEKTFRGFLYNPKNLPGSEQSNAYPMLPSAFIEQVTWFDIGDGPKTLCLSVLMRDWVPRPMELPILGTDKTRIAVGRVVGDVPSGQSTFFVRQLRMVVGELPSDDPNAMAATNNTHDQAYTNDATIMIFSEEGSVIWDTDRSGGGGGLIRFELAEDMDLLDFARKAYLLDADDNRVLQPDTTIPIEIWVGNAWQRHQGYKEYTDLIYEYQVGYRGFGSFLLSDYFGSTLYEIVDMEQEARWISGTFNEEMIADATSVKCLIDKYWGHAPNGRSPKTEVIEEGTTGQDPIYGIRVWDEQDLVTSTLPEGTKYRAVFDEKNKKYILASVQVKPGSILRRFKAVSSIGAASGLDAGQEGGGTAQIYHDDRSPDGAPQGIVNGFLDSFDDKSVGYVDISKNPPEIISVGCTTAP